MLSEFYTEDGCLMTIQASPALLGRLMAGGALSALVGLVLVLNAGAAGIFLERLFGGDRAWPRRTQLLVEVPLAGALPLAPPEAGRASCRERV